MEIPVAQITDDREHMIMRAICDERISLPLEAFKGHPEIYDQIVAILPADQLMDVKVAWRCNTTQYEVDAAAAGPLYAKLGYSAAAIEGMNLNPFGGHVNLTAQGAKLLGEEPAHSHSIAYLRKTTIIQPLTLLRAPGGGQVMQVPQTVERHTLEVGSATTQTQQSIRYGGSITRSRKTSTLGP